MDSYLVLARNVLTEARQPLSAREILSAAYQMQIVPRDLYGKTQHKTLQARLSTDLLQQQSRSEFFRTGPGRFFLRSLLTDKSLPLTYRREYIAPLRADQLGRFQVLTVDRGLAVGASRRGEVTKFDLSDLGRWPWRYAKLETVRRQPEIVPFNLITMISLGNRLLVKQIEAPASPNGKSRWAIGLRGFVKLEDWSLFSDDEIGLTNAAWRIVAEQLRLPLDTVEKMPPSVAYEETAVLYEELESPTINDLVVVVPFDCTGTAEVAEAVASGSNFAWRHAPLSLGPMDVVDRWSKNIIEIL